jgi:hypothetical protein
MKLDFRHSKLLANPVHLLAVHISKQYGQIGQYVQWRYYYAVFKIYLCDTAIYARPTLNTGGSRVSIQHHNDWAGLLLLRFSRERMCSRRAIPVQEVHQ